MISIIYNIEIKKGSRMKKERSHHHYNKKLKHIGRTLRNNMTKAEASLWKYGLKNKQRGYTFNRQRPVLSFVADFMCKDIKLIIEVDGSTHDNPSAFKKDRERDLKLEKVGFKVLRFTNEDVLRNMDSVILKIDKVIKQLES